MTVKQAIQALQDGKKVKYTLELCLGVAGSIPQSITLYDGMQEQTIKHLVECHKRDNKPYKNARFIIEE